MNTKYEYQQVARIINKVCEEYRKNGFNPNVRVIEHKDSKDKYALLINDDLFDLAEYSNSLQDLLRTDIAFIVGDKDLYLEKINKMLFQLF